MNENIVEIRIKLEGSYEDPITKLDNIRNESFALNDYIGVIPDIAEEFQKVVEKHFDEEQKKWLLECLNIMTAEERSAEAMDMIKSILIVAHSKKPLHYMTVAVEDADGDFDWCSYFMELFMEQITLLGMYAIDKEE